MSTADTTCGKATSNLLSCIDNNAEQVDSFIVSEITSSVDHFLRPGSSKPELVSIQQKRLTSKL
jgi:hypothetical protein